LATGSPARDRNRSYGAAADYVHACVDDHSRLAFTEIHPDQSATSAVAHLRAAVAWHAAPRSG